MKHMRYAFVLAALLLVAGIAAAQVSQNYDLSWHVVGGGGAPVASSAHQVNGTLGQLAIGPAGSAGQHSIGSGYWYGVHREAPGCKIYLPLVVRGGG